MLLSRLKKSLMAIGLTTMLLLPGCGAPIHNQSPKPITNQNVNPVDIKPVKYTDHLHFNAASSAKTEDSTVLPLLQPGTTGKNALWLNEALSLLHYLPVQFVSLDESESTASTSMSDNLTTIVSTAAFADQLRYGNLTPSSGKWVWTANYPQSLASLWNPNVVNTITYGAIMSFESQHGLSPDGIAGPLVYAALQKALLANQVSQSAYTYVTVSKTLPERLEVWQNGREVFESPANTGISESPTPNGTWPIMALHKAWAALNCLFPQRKRYLALLTMELW